MNNLQRNLRLVSSRLLVKYQVYNNVSVNLLLHLLYLSDPENVQVDEECDRQSMRIEVSLNPICEADRKQSAEEPQTGNFSIAFAKPGLPKLLSENVLIYDFCYRVINKCE